MSGWDELVLADQRRKYNLERLLGLDADTWSEAFVAEEWPSGLADGLHAAGVLERGAPLPRPVCRGCDRYCAIDVDEREQPDGTLVLVGACEEGVAAGLLTFPLSALDTLRLDAGAVARAVARGLQLEGDVDEASPGRVWRLGELAGVPRRAVYLARGRDPLPACVPEAHAVVLATHPDRWAAVLDVPVFPLRRVVGVDGPLTFDPTPLAPPAKGKATRATVRPVAIPAGATWRQVTIRFVDDDTVDVVVGALRERRSAADFGMTDGRKSGSVPTEPWKLLRAMAKNGGRLTWSGEGASDKARWYIKQLREGISAMLPLEGSPIRDYSAGRGWVTAFALVDGRG